MGVIRRLAVFSETAAGGRPDITFDVMLDVPSDGVVDLDTVPDVLGLTGRRPEAAVVRVLQRGDEWSVRALSPHLRSWRGAFMM